MSHLPCKGDYVSLKASQTHTLFGLSINDEDDTPERRAAIDGVLERLDITICYCSFYNPCEPGHTSGVDLNALRDGVGIHPESTAYNTINTDWHTRCANLPTGYGGR